MGGKEVLKALGVGLVLAILILAAGIQGQIVLEQGQSQPPCTITLSPGQSIQEAIDLAPDGAVICLEPGEWQENLVIEKSITLKAAEIKVEPTVVIKSAKWGWPVILIKSDREIEVRVKGLKITGAFGECENYESEQVCASGIEVYGHAKVMIQNNTISANKWHGITMWNSSQATITNNTISGNGDGIAMGGSSQTTITNNTISGNKWYGIAMYDSSQATITNNTSDGILMYDSSQATIENNTIRGNAVGIEMGGFAQATITNNAVSDNYDGINMEDSSQAKIENNTISGNKRNGIVMTGSSQAMIKNNTISSNTFGIVMYDSSQATIESNTISDSKWHVIWMGNFSQATIENNTISDNAEGIGMWGFAQATIENNTISGNWGEGIWMGNSSQATIRDNKIFANKGYGVALFLKSCGFKYGAESFAGKVEGNRNEIHDNFKGDVCPAELKFLMAKEGGCYGPECKGG